MKTILVITAVACFSLTLSAIELDDTFDEWDIIIKSCIANAVELNLPNAEEETLQIISKARNGGKLNCSEKVILVLETQKVIGDLIKRKNADKKAMAWNMVTTGSDRLDYLMEKENPTLDEQAELLIYYSRLEKALKMFFPDCFTP